MVAVLLLLFSGAVVYGRYYILGPALRITDPQWRSLHSDDAFWLETQESMRRMGWAHNDGFYAGEFADKPFMEELMSTMHPADEFGCFSGHKECALALITNHGPEDSEGYNGQTWLDWWEENKTKSQEEWIADGFAEVGIEVHCPPTEEDFEPLLMLLGTDAQERDDEDDEDDDDGYLAWQFEESGLLLEDEKGEIPRHLAYNAYRWLRDSGKFDPVEYAMTNVNEATPESVKRGLREYYSRMERSSTEGRVGILTFGKELPDYDPDVPWFLHTDGIATVYSMVSIPMILGAFLIGISLRKPKKQEANAAAG